VTGDISPGTSVFIGMEVGNPQRGRSASNDTTSTQIVVIVSTTGINIDVYIFYIGGGTFVAFAANTVPDDGNARRVTITRNATDFVVTIKNAGTLVTDLDGTIPIADVDNGAAASFVGAGYADAQTLTVANDGFVDNLVSWA
jgi:hypothetical protein